MGSRWRADGSWIWLLRWIGENGSSYFPELARWSTSLLNWSFMSVAFGLAGLAFLSTSGQFGTGTLHSSAGRWPPAASSAQVFEPSWITTFPSPGLSVIFFRSTRMVAS